MKKLEQIDDVIILYHPLPFSPDPSEDPSQHHLFNPCSWKIKPSYSSCSSTTTTFPNSPAPDPPNFGGTWRDFDSGGSDPSSSPSLFPPPTFPLSPLPPPHLSSSPASSHPNPNPTSLNLGLGSQREVAGFVVLPPSLFRECLVNGWGRPHPLAGTVHHLYLYRREREEKKRRYLFIFLCIIFYCNVFDLLSLIFLFVFLFFLFKIISFHFISFHF